MKRIAVFALTFLLIASTSVPAMGQASRYKLRTQTDRGNLQPSPSFRGGGQTDRQQGFDVQPGIPMRGGVSSEEGVVGMSLGYQVHVLGEVARPGTYRMPASSRWKAIFRSVLMNRCLWTEDLAGHCVTLRYPTETPGKS